MSSRASPQRAPVVGTSVSQGATVEPNERKRNWLVSLAGVAAFVLLLLVLAASRLQFSDSFRRQSGVRFLRTRGSKLSAIMPEGCAPQGGRLFALNWTDGDPGFDEAKLCTWQPEPQKFQSKGSSICASQLAIPQLQLKHINIFPKEAAVKPRKNRWAAGCRPAAYGMCYGGHLWQWPKVSTGSRHLFQQQEASVVNQEKLSVALKAGRIVVLQMPGSAFFSKYNLERQIWESAGKSVGEAADSRFGTGLIQQQDLFSVYVHTPPEMALLPNDSLFYGTEISPRSNSTWGTFELVEVARKLLAAALENPLNQRFMTLSESCIPLYPPQTVYYQLMYSQESRINACTSKPTPRDEYRWTFRMEEMTGRRLNKSMWRKNSQWLSLSRKHARLTVADREIAETFAKHCYSGKDPDYGGWWRTCFPDVRLSPSMGTVNLPVAPQHTSPKYLQLLHSKVLKGNPAAQEHYFSTLLAFHGLDQETDCMGELTHAVWCDFCQGDERLHPKVYTAKEVSTTLIRELRQEQNGCDAQGIHRAAAAAVPRLADFAANAKCDLEPSDRNYMLPSKKFLNGSEPVALQAVLRLFMLEGAVHSQGSNC